MIINIIIIIFWGDVPIPTYQLPPLGNRLRGQPRTTQLRRALIN